MKKLFLSICGLIICCSLSAQRVPADFAKAVRTDPQVTIVIDSVGTDCFTVSFTPNEVCAYYKCLGIATADISMWTGMMGMTVEQLTALWGFTASADTSYTWTDMEPNTAYTILALPYGSDSVSTLCNSAELTTAVLGGSGTSIIAVTVENIADTSALVTCTPNDQTAMFYDGLISVEYYNEIGQDSVIALFTEELPFYSTDSWLWTTLHPSTDYYVFARGKNADQVWGDITLYPFSTTETVGIEQAEQTPISVFPIPNDGHFMILNNGTEEAVLQIYTITGQLCSQYDLTQSVSDIKTQLTSGTYILQVMNKRGVVIGSKKMVVR